MKLVAKDTKVKITWTKTYFQTTQYGLVIGYDAKCSCGWETRYGGGLKSAITQEVFSHKWIEHDYELVSTYPTEKEGNK